MSAMPEPAGFASTFAELSREELLTLARKQAAELRAKTARLASVEELVESLMGALPSTAAPVSQGRLVSSDCASGPEVRVLEEERLAVATRLSVVESALAAAEAELKQKITALAALETKVEAWKAKVVESKAKDLRTIAELRTRLGSGESSVEKPLPTLDECPATTTAGTTSGSSSSGRPNKNNNTNHTTTKSNYSNSEDLHVEDDSEEPEQGPDTGAESSTSFFSSPGASPPAAVMKESKLSPSPGEAPATLDWVGVVERRLEDFAGIVEELQERCTALTGENQRLTREVKALNWFKLTMFEGLEGHVAHREDLYAAIQARKKALQE